MAPELLEFIRRRRATKVGSDYGNVYEEKMAALAIKIEQEFNNDQQISNSLELEVPTTLAVVSPQEDALDPSSSE